MKVQIRFSWQSSRRTWFQMWKISHLIQLFTVFWVSAPLHLFSALGSPFTLQGSFCRSWRNSARTVLYKSIVCYCAGTIEMNIGFMDKKAYFFPVVRGTISKLYDILWVICSNMFALSCLSFFFLHILSVTFYFLCRIIWIRCYWDELKGLSTKPLTLMCLFGTAQ